VNQQKLRDVAPAFGQIGVFSLLRKFGRLGVDFAIEFFGP
jgi:hypothetical protein